MPDFVEMAEKFGVDEVYFSKVEDWGAFGCGKFEEKDVAHPEHSQHSDLVQILNDERLNKPFVRLGNLTRIKNESTRKQIN
jgi:hypothetical protein